WLKACYGVDITDGGDAFVRSLHAKYSSDPTYKAWGYWWPFVAQAVKNLRQWGFNALGEYTSNYAMPVDTNNRGRGNRERMPFIALTNAANYAKQRYGVKDLMFGVDEAVTPNLWRVEGFPDVFDPAFARAVDELTWSGPLPWLLGSSTDDRDYIFGFGPSRTLGGWHNHLGWQAAATRPAQTSNHRVWVGNKQGVTYTDTTVHTKLALRDHLRSKYRALEELNGAWGSSYTTWDSDGTPWPKGRGLLDECGRSPWLGRDFYSMKDAAPAIRHQGLAERRSADPGRARARVREVRERARRLPRGRRHVPVRRHRLVGVLRQGHRRRVAQLRPRHQARQPVRRRRRARSAGPG